MADTMGVLQEAATSKAEALRVIELVWTDVPPLANELGLLLSALARATLELFPALYGCEQAAGPTRWSEARVETEAHSITRAVQGANGSACRRILSACHRGQLPSLGKMPRAEQARQFALALDPSRLLVLVAVLNLPESSQALLSLAQGTEWLAGNSRSRVVLVLPAELADRGELDHVSYCSCLFADARSTVKLPQLRAGSQRPRAVEPPPAALASGESTGALLQPLVNVSPVVGTPAKNSEAEQVLSERLSRDQELKRLFAFNQPVVTTSGFRPIVDLLWAAGKLVIEIDGEEHRRLQKFSQDRARDYELLLSGYSVVRFTTWNVVDRTDWVVERIRQAVRYLNQRERA
ncbi:MAG TPA: DUF559 domain-containing protein [Polyangiaceae bacterium]|nr:DUF559 domain-containing protein [Polyangiaceae bacterium]